MAKTKVRNLKRRRRMMRMRMMKMKHTMMMIIMIIMTISWWWWQRWRGWDCEYDDYCVNNWWWWWWWCVMMWLYYKVLLYIKCVMIFDRESNCSIITTIIIVPRYSIHLEFKFIIIYWFTSSSSFMSHLFIIIIF